MDNHHFFPIVTTILTGITAIHAILTWPANAVLVFFIGGAIIAFVAEAIVINAGWLEHHIGLQFLGVPLYVGIAWPGLIYIVFRISMLLTSGLTAIALTGILATIFTVITDPYGVAQNYWTYTADMPGFRYRNVPWWNFVGWLLISSGISAFTIMFL
ncbi:MAG: carotenoid biosynthesis protein [Halobacteriaceae archaeon]